MIAMLVLSSVITLLAAAVSNALSLHPAETSRRNWLSETSRGAASIFLPGAIASRYPEIAIANDEENTYSNPNIPAAPEERSGLIVLRVAEVAQFQGMSYE
jgi:hypothetical protein